MEYGCKYRPIEINYLAKITNLISVKIPQLAIIFVCSLYSWQAMAQQITRMDFFETGNSTVLITQIISEPDSVKSQADRLLREKISDGFLEAYWEVQSRLDTTWYQMILGAKYGWVKIDGIDSLGLSINLTDSTIISFSEPYRWLENWVSSQEKRGYPFAKANLQVVSMFSGRLTGQVELDPGPYIVWDSLQVKGNTRSRKEYLQRLSGIIPGTPFSQVQFDQGVKKIKTSPYFISQSAPELQFRTRQAVPVFSLQDRKINIFDGIIGFLPNANQPGKLLVTGQVDLRLFHLGGKGREAGFQWQKLNQQSQSLDVRWRERFVFGSPLDVEANFSLLKQDSSFVNRSFELDFGLQVSDRNYLTLFHKRQSGDLIGSDAKFEEGILDQLRDFRWNHYGVKWDWSSLDQVENPRRGRQIQGELSVGNKRIIKNSRLPQKAYANLDQSSLQMRGKLALEQHIYVGPRYGIWLNLEGGHIQNQSLFLNEFFRLGGIQSIRGFYESFFFTNSFAYLNMEQRFYIDAKSYLVAFSDLGVLNNPFANPALDRPVSFGSGINLDTGQGLFSFVLALGSSNAQPMSFSYSRVHFGYSARF